jgi:hypothetical protein
VLAVALAFGTLLRETPEGRRRLDDLGSGWRRARELLRQEGLPSLAAPIMEFFKGVMRAFAALLHRIRTRLSPRLGEPVRSTLVKAVAAPP